MNTYITTITGARTALARLNNGTAQKMFKKLYSLSCERNSNMQEYMLAEPDEEENIEAEGAEIDNAISALETEIAKYIPSILLTGKEWEEILIPPPCEDCLHTLQAEDDEIYVHLPVEQLNPDNHYFFTYWDNGSDNNGGLGTPMLLCR
ncbi:MAG: hypothetical protein IJN05_08000 [Ruminococcus sp.]|nr:hypothetical protein [Ruminococcus sp.]